MLNVSEVKPERSSEPLAECASARFSEMLISPYVKERLAAARFTMPTPVQAAAIPHARHGISSSDKENRIDPAERTADDVLLRDDGRRYGPHREGLSSQCRASLVWLDLEAIGKCARAGV